MREEMPDVDETSAESLEGALTGSGDGGRRLIVGFLAVAFVLGAVVPWRAGCGPFGTRILFSKSAEIYVMNKSGASVWVEAEHGREVQVDDGHLVTFSTITGAQRLRLRREDGSYALDVTRTWGRRTFLNTPGGGCAVVFDITGLYGGRDEGIRVIDRVTPEQPIHDVQSTMVLLPRRTVPPQAMGTITWIEDMPCELVLHEDQAYMMTQAEVRLRHRFERDQEARERQRP